MDRFYIRIATFGGEAGVNIGSESHNRGAEAVVDANNYEKLLRSRAISHAVCRRLRDDAVLEAVVVSNGQVVPEKEIKWMPINKSVLFPEVRSTLEEKKSAAYKESQAVAQAKRDGKEIDEMWPMVRRPRQLFIFGAGASEPYGIPLWKDLKKLMLNKLEEDFNYGASLNDRLTSTEKVALKNILNKVDNGYDTIDEAITAEVEKMEGGNLEAMTLERRFFDTMSRCLCDENLEKRSTGKETNALGWVGKLLRADIKVLENSNFISFNYDAVLGYELRRYVPYLEVLRTNKIIEKTAKADRKFPRKQRWLDEDVEKAYENAIAQIEAEANEGREKISKNIQTGFYFPHGLFSTAYVALSQFRIDESHYMTYIGREQDMRMGYGANAVSHKDAPEKRDVFKKIREETIVAEHLYVIGLGGGLKENLKKIDLENMGIEKIFYTCFDPKDEDYYRDYFLKERKFRGEVKLKSFKDCDEFVAAYVKKASRWK